MCLIVLLCFLAPCSLWHFQSTVFFFIVCISFSYFLSQCRSSISLLFYVHFKLSASIFQNFFCLSMLFHLYALQEQLRSPLFIHTFSFCLFHKSHSLSFFFSHLPLSLSITCPAANVSNFSRHLPPFRKIILFLSRLGLLLACLLLLYQIVLSLLYK